MKIYWSGDSKNIIGAKVRALRLEKKWSQHDLATKVQLLGCECSDLTILRIEKGDRFVPDYEVKALAKVFNVSYESPIRRLKRSLRERFHYFIRGERSNAAFRKQSVAVLLSLAPHEVRRGCDRSRLAGIHGEAMYTAPNSAGRAALQATICQCKISLGGLKGGYSLLKESIPLFPFIRAVPSALLSPLHAQREKSPLICKDKKTTPRCCVSLRSSIPLRRASRAPPLRGHQ